MTMDCREARELAEAYVSGQLSHDDARAVAAHVGRCASCDAEIEGLRRLREATRAAVHRSEALRVRPEFVTEVRARLATQAAREVEVRTPRRAWLAAAAGLLLVLGLGLGVRQWSASAFSSVMNAAVGDHRFCAVTYQLTERPIRLELAAQRYGGVYRQLESLDLSGLELSGGPVTILERHSCVYGGRRFAHLVLRYKGERLSLVIGEDPRPAPVQWMDGSSATPVSLVEADGFRVSSFRSARQLVFVVSSLSESDAEEFARAIAPPLTRTIAGV